MGLGSLQTYQVDFQTAYIEATSGFYFKASSLWLNSETLISYMKTVLLNFHSQILIVGRNNFKG